MNENFNEITSQFILSTLNPEMSVVLPVDENTYAYKVKFYPSDDGGAVIINYSISQNGEVIDSFPFSYSLNGDSGEIKFETNSHNVFSIGNYKFTNGYQEISFTMHKPIESNDLPNTFAAAVEA